MKTLLLTLLMAAANAQAGVFCAFLQCDGVNYTNCTVDKVNPAEASLWSDEAGARVKLSALPASVQKALDYDPAAAQQYLAQIKAQKQAAAERVSEQKRSALERWKAANVRIVAGSMIVLREFKTYSGTVVDFKSGCPVIQTFATNNSYESVYYQAEGNAAIGAYAGPMAAPATRLASSSVVPSARFVVVHYPGGNAAPGETLIIRAVPVLNSCSTNGLGVLDCGLPYAAH